MVLVDGSKAAFTLQVLKLNLEFLRFDFFFCMFIDLIFKCDVPEVT